MPTPLIEKHRATLDAALNAIRTRTFHSAFPEVPSGKIYGETAKKDGFAAFDALLKSPFELDQPGQRDMIGSEASPFGIELGVTYPRCELDALCGAAESAMDSWRNTTPDERAAICIEMLTQLNASSFEMACAVMHTTGQGFMMAFQAGGPHAQDRGLEAVAYAYDAMQFVPKQTTWTKQVGKDAYETLEKKFHLVPRGVAATIACSTFPTWNSYPGIFASLMTGNAVIIKPHPGAVLPLALTVRTMRAVLADNGFDPNLVLLLVDTPNEPIARELVTNDAIHIVDYTGSSAFGDWIEANATQAQVFTEKAGVNSVIIDSIADLRGTTGNLAFSLCLYSGQMCTTPQNIFIPRDGITVEGEHKSFDDVAGAIVKAVDWFLSEPARASEVLGGIQNPMTMKRALDAASDGGTVLRPAAAMENANFPDARVCSPAIISCDVADESLYMREMFGPVVYIIAVDDTDQAIETATRCARELGAITAAAYSTETDVLTRAEDACVRAGVPLSCNLTGGVYVNQSAAFSDYHVTGANPAGNATLCDSAYVASRFRVVHSRVPVPANAEKETPAHAGV